MGGGGGATGTSVAGATGAVVTLGVVVVELLADVSEYATPPAAITAMSAAAPIAYCGNRLPGRAGVLIGPVGGMYATRGRAPVRSMAYGFSSV